MLSIVFSYGLAQSQTANHDKLHMNDIGKPINYCLTESPKQFCSSALHVAMSHSATLMTTSASRKLPFDQSQAVYLNFLIQENGIAQLIIM